MAITRVEISFRTIVFTAGFLVFLWLIYTIRATLLALLIAVILMSALNPFVTNLEKKKIPRPVAILIAFAIILLVLSGITAAIIPPLIDQTRSLINQIPTLFQRFDGVPIDQRVISDQLGSLPSNIAHLVISTFSNLIALFTLFVLTYYLLAERGNLHRYLVIFFGRDKREERGEAFINKLEHQIGGWVRGELALMLIIGILTYIGLRILGVNFALPLAILAGVLEIVPNIGPTLSMIPAVVLALTSSPITALATVALYFLIQQFENNIIVPKVMQKAVGVKPLITIVALMIGLKLAGALGAILAVPGYLILKIVIEEIYAANPSQKA